MSSLDLEESIESLVAVCSDMEFKHDDTGWSVETEYGYGTAPTFLGVVDLAYTLVEVQDND